MWVGVAVGAYVMFVWKRVCARALPACFAYPAPIGSTYGSLPSNPFRASLHRAAGRRLGATGGGSSALANAGQTGPPRKLRRYRGDAPSERTAN